MTAAEWMACREPAALWPSATAQQLRHFLAAACRICWGGHEAPEVVQALALVDHLGELHVRRCCAVDLIGRGG